MPKAATLKFETPKQPKATLKEASRRAGRTDLQGKRLVATRLPQAAYMELRMLAARLDTTQAELIEEALTDLISKYKDRL